MTTTTTLQLDPPLTVMTPRGKAEAYFKTEYGPDSYTIFGCFLRDSGEYWEFRGPFVRLFWNETMGTGQRPPDSVKPEINTATKPAPKPTDIMSAISHGQDAQRRANEANSRLMQNQPNQLQDGLTANITASHGRYMHLPAGEILPPGWQTCPECKTPNACWPVEMCKRVGPERPL